MTLAQCNASCTPGYYCDSASLSTTFAICSAGTYSTSNATTCTPCPPGTFGILQGLGTTACNGNCTAGFYCPAGSTLPSLLACPPGQYSQSGWGACVSTQLPTTERQSLVDLYISTSGPSWRLNTGWSAYASGSDPCASGWLGVSCSPTSATTPYHVTYVLLVLRRFGDSLSEAEWISRLHIGFTGITADDPLLCNVDVFRGLPVPTGR